MRRPATVSFRPTGRTALLAALVAAVVATSGCSWFNRDGGIYAKSEANRPLEVPPDLDLPAASAAVAASDAPSSALRSQTTAQGGASSAAATSMAAASGGFNVALPSDQAFARVGEVLAGMEGLQIASKAQLLGAYDVSYRGANFLVRVTAVEGGSYISAVDPRGVPATGDGPSTLMSVLEAALGG